MTKIELWSLSGLRTMTKMTDLALCSCVACETHPERVCEFYGSCDGMCSFCNQVAIKGAFKCKECDHRATVNDLCVTHHKIKQGTVSHNDAPLTDQDIALWANTGIHACKKGDCVVCLENTNIITKWTCACAPSVCEGCHPRVMKCPICRVGTPYANITKQNLMQIVSGNFSTHSMFGIVSTYGRQYNDIDECNLKNFVCTAKDVTDVLNQARTFMTITWKEEHKLFSFALDLWNIPRSLPSYCYKGGHEFENTHNRTYNKINYWRPKQDEGLLSVQFKF